MQGIIRKNPNASPIMDDVDRLYMQLSDFEGTRPLIKQKYGEWFEPLVDVFEEFTGHTWDVEYEDRKYSGIAPIDNNNIILAFSGGKDSIASAIRFKETGKNVYLYHLKHINPSFSDEWKCAQALADLLELPIFFDDIKLTGHHPYMEHPMKNMLIGNGALSYGIREKITTNIAFGNYTNSYLDDNVFDRCAGDCVDMWDFYNNIIKQVIPDFEIKFNLKHMGDTLDAISDRPDLLNESLSCLCRHSLRDYRRQWVKDKFGVELFQKRCGSCYKCCVEYIYMADHNKISYSEPYYKYCLGQLYKVARAEDIKVNSVTELWENYFAYSYKESKIAKQIEYALLGTQKIVWQKC